MIPFFVGGGGDASLLCREKPVSPRPLVMEEADARSVATSKMLQSAALLCGSKSMLEFVDVTVQA